MDILDILLDILLKPPQPFKGLFLFGNFEINDRISSPVVGFRKMLFVFLGITFKYDSIFLFGFLFCLHNDHQLWRSMCQIHLQFSCYLLCQYFPHINGLL